MSELSENIVKIKKQLLPTGRAFNVANDTYFHGLLRATALTEAQLYSDSIAILNSLLPDNDEFTSDDATDWERRLGLVTNLSTPLADRKLAIRRKMAAPGTQPAKGHYLYIQTQLQAAGFNVYVHENLFPLYPTGYENVAPNSLYGNSNFVTPQYGDFQYSDFQYGGYYNNLVVNSIYQTDDSKFNIGNSLACTFFIGGQAIGTYANVLASREIEFRQLILSLKQTQLVGLLFVNYI
jgi:hypothetical protein